MKRATIETATVAARGPAALAALGTDLEALIVALGHEHAGLLEAVKEHRTALAKADVEGVERAVGRENERVQVIAELERRRLAVLGRIAEATGQSGAPASQRPTLAWAAGLLPEPVRGRVLLAGAALKERLMEVSSHTKVVRQAAESVAMQMEGLLRQMSQRLSHAGTYGPGGRVQARTQVVTALDVRS
jgi:hypothetical protein